MKWHSKKILIGGLQTKLFGEKFSKKFCIVQFNAALIMRIKFRVDFFAISLCLQSTTQEMKMVKESTSR